MSLFISGMNLSVIVFPPASPRPSSLHTHLAGWGRQQWGVLLPKPFQHQPFSVLWSKEVAPGASPAASQAQRSLPGLGRATAVVSSRSASQKWHCWGWRALGKEVTVQAECPALTHTHTDLTQLEGCRRCPVGLPGQTDAMWLCRSNSCRFARLCSCWKRL